MIGIITPIIILTAGGGVMGLILGLADKFFHMEVDPLIEDLREVLPGINCGACGYIGCDEYAQAMAKDKSVSVSLCVPGGEEVTKQLAHLTGAESSGVKKKTAVVHCNGNCNVTEKAFDYKATPTCWSAYTYYQGDGNCRYSCIGLADCVKVCPFDALHICNGVAVVDKELCTGCGICVSACPKGLISVEPSRGEHHVVCSSKSKGPIVRKICSVGCIGCGLCEKSCEFDAIVMADNLAHIIVENCTNCGECMKVCPTNSIALIPDLIKA